MIAPHIAFCLLSMPLLVHATLWLILKLADSLDVPSGDDVSPSPRESAIAELSDATPTRVSVVDVKLPLSHQCDSKLSERLVFCYTPTGTSGNVLEVSQAANFQEKLVLVSKMAEALQALHSSDVIHSNISPDAFRVEDGYLTLSDAKRYAAAQGDREVKRIKTSRSHLYKARAELAQDPHTSSEAMDVFSFAKTVTAMYTGFHPTLVFSKSIPPPIRPPTMPEALWEVVHPCLKEDLVDVPSIDEVVLKLKESLLQPCAA